MRATLPPPPFKAVPVWQPAAAQDRGELSPGAAVLLASGPDEKAQTNNGMHTSTTTIFPILVFVLTIIGLTQILSSVLKFFDESIVFAAEFTIVSIIFHLLINLHTCNALRVVVDIGSDNKAC